MLNYSFLGKGLGIVSPPHFVSQMSLMLYSINWQNFIASLLLLLEVLVNICVATVSQVMTLYILKLTLSF